MELESVGQKISRAMQGNQNARPAHRLISDTLRMIAVQNPKRLRTICDKMMTKAEDDVQAFREIADRIEGKVSSQEHVQIKIIISKSLDSLPPVEVVAASQDDDAS